MSSLLRYHTGQTWERVNRNVYAVLSALYIAAQALMLVRPGVGEPYVDVFCTCYRIYIGLVLAYIFNPYAVGPVTQTTRNVAFSAGGILALSIIVKELADAARAVVHVGAEQK